MAIKTKRYLEKRKLIQSEKKLEKKYYRILIGLLIFGAIYYYFIQPKTIGHDIRYNIFVFWIPTLTGIIALGIYRRQFLINEFKINKGFISRAFMMFLYFLEGIMFSYLIFGQIANVCWNTINQNVAKTNPVETINCKLTNFCTGKNSYNGMYFIFQDRSEKIKTDYSTIKNYLDKNPEKYELVVEVQKGIWNHYLLKNWEIKEK